MQFVERCVIDGIAGSCGTALDEVHCTMANECAQLRHADGRSFDQAQGMIGGMQEIGCCIDEGSVEIENQGFNWHACAFESGLFVNVRGLC
jgi:hypothetical protein